MSASLREGSLWYINFLSLKNRMFPIVRVFVVPESFGLEVLLYSQDRIAKKNAPEISCAVAMDGGSSGLANSNVLLITDTGTAFWRFSTGSSALKLDICLCSICEILLFSSTLGSGRPFSRKV